VRQYKARWSIGPQQFGNQASAAISPDITFATIWTCGGAAVAARHRLPGRWSSAHSERFFVLSAADVCHRNGERPSARISRQHDPQLRLIVWGDSLNNMTVPVPDFASA
jgi:hypothetical protein